MRQERSFLDKVYDFKHFTKETYSLSLPMGDSEKFATIKLKAKIGLVKTKSGQTIPIEFAGGNTLKQKSQL